MIIYNYHSQTKEYLGKDVADQDPMTPDNWLIPANATSTAPPQVPANEVAIYQNDGIWLVQPDFRNTLYYKPDGSPSTITEIGVLPDPDWSLEPIPKGLDQFKADKALLIDDTCRQSIYAGFISFALGTAHHYPANDKDQQNLVGSVTESLYPNLAPEWVTPFWCATNDADGEWAYRPHSVAQIQQVGTDAKAEIVAALTKNAMLQAQIAAIQVNEAMTEAQAIEAVEAIVWEQPS